MPTGDVTMGGNRGAAGAVMSSRGCDREEWLRQEVKRSLKWYSVFGCSPAISHLVPGHHRA